MKKESITAIILFILSYGILYLLSFVLHNWESPFYFLLPIPGFFFAYILSDRIENFLQYNNPFVLVIGILILGVVAYYINLHWYYYNMYYLMLRSNPQLEELGMNFGIYLYGGKLKNGQTINGIGFNFFEHLKNEPFIVFLLSVILGYLAYKLKPSIMSRL